MEQLEVLKLLVSKLEKASIHYFITGSIANSYYGIPRFTHDIDVVLTVGKLSISAFLSRRGQGHHGASGIGAEPLSSVG